MDAALEDLRARVRRGDEAAREALRRAVLRAGRPIELAWEGLPLALGPGIGALAPAERARVDEDLATIDAPRLVALVQRLDPCPGVILAAYRRQRWLVATRASSAGTDEDVVIDAVELPPVHRLIDVADRRGCWHVDWEEITSELPGSLLVSRLLDAGRALFQRLDIPFDEPHVERTEPSAITGESTTRWTSGVAAVQLRARCEAGAPVGRGEISGLPGGGRLILERDGGAWWSYRLDARRGDAARLEQAWLAAVADVAGRPPADP